MIKLCYLITIFLVCYCDPLFSNIINKINVSGNKSISNDRIIELSGLEHNRYYSNIELNKSLKLIFKTGVFREVNFTISSDYILNIYIKQKYKLKTVLIDGSFHLKQKILKSNLLSTKDFFFHYIV